MEHKIDRGMIMDLLQAESHAIVETEDKKWIDVSPHDGHAEILFLL